VFANVSEVPMANEGLSAARKSKNDEFYTLYADIEKEMNAYLEFNPDVFRGATILLPCDDPEWSNFTKYFAQRFEHLGLKKLISTSYAPNSKPKDIPHQPTLFEMDSPEFDEEKTYENGKIFTLTRDMTGDDAINVDDLQWSYLEGDGDFRSDEIKALRDEATHIITNPPFSLFREFLAWIIQAKKKFLMIGNVNCISYKEVFPLLRENDAWLGNGMGRWISGFMVPENYELYGTEARIEEGKRVVSTNNALWLTNIDHGRRHRPLPLMTMVDNLKFNKAVMGIGYQKYDNYDAIEVPRTDAIPSDYDGVMGVPISFLDKYNPDQFELLGMSGNGEVPAQMLIPGQEKYDRPYLDGARMYVRLLIRHRRAAK
jgi:hypothetical protein